MTASAPLPHLTVVTIGHVDHGKSTLMGRLLYETGFFPQDKLARVQQLAKLEGRRFEWAFLLDAFWEEQAQNITIDRTALPLETAQRSFTLIDVPGHREFLKNMMTGAAQAELGLLLLDAERGLEQQTKEHLALLPLLGIRDLVVVINKMDRINFEQNLYEQRCDEVRALLESTLWNKVVFLPLVATSGWNLIDRHQDQEGCSGAGSWYQDSSLLRLLESWELSPNSLEQEHQPLRMMVQDLYAWDSRKEKEPGAGDRRWIVGKVLSGKVAVGEKILLWPGAKEATIAAFGDGKRELLAGASFSMRLAEPAFVERGYSISRADSPFPLRSTHQLWGRLFWFGSEPLGLGEKVSLQLGVATCQAHVEKILAPSSQAEENDSFGITQKISEEMTCLQPYSWGDLFFSCESALVVDTSAKVPPLSRWSLQKGGELVGAAMLLPTPEHHSLSSRASVEKRSTPSQASTTPASLSQKKASHLSRTLGYLSSQDRAALRGHSGAIIWLTGLSGAGKSTLGSALERDLYQQQWSAFLLDGDNIRHGLSVDLGFSTQDRAENIRRVGEAALLLAQAGVVAIAALISPLALERAKVRQRAVEEGVAFMEVFINASLSQCETRDPKGLYRQARAGIIREFSGIDAPYEAPPSPDLMVRTDQLSLKEAERLLLEKTISFLRNSMPRLGGKQGNL